MVINVDGNEGFFSMGIAIWRRWVLQHRDGRRFGELRELRWWSSSPSAHNLLQSARNERMVLCVAVTTAAAGS